MARSTEYRDWLKIGWAELQSQGRGHMGFVGPVKITLHVPENGRRDLDNHCKPVIDLLCHAEVIDGDRNKTVRAIDMRWHKDPALLIEIETAT
jgi:Holliday junction resolvase RusA-like endonuclease